MKNIKSYHKINYTNILTYDYFKLRIIITTFMFFIFTIHNSKSWTGYDRSSNVEIEIGSGNLVREGEIIKFYDWDAEEDRKAEVVDIEYNLGNVRLEIYDFNLKEARTFDMESN